MLEVQETNKIREFARAICEIPEKPSEIELRKKRSIGIEWESLEERQRVARAKLIN